MPPVPIRYPAPLRPGDRIGVTAPSSGVDDRLRPRLEFAVQGLRDKGFQVIVGDCIGTPSHISGPKQQRADELMSMLTDPSIRAVVPPWGGETGIDVLDLLDFDAVAAAEPTWYVGYSDTSTTLTPLTLLTGIATIHGQNLMDTPYTVPSGIRHWLDVAAAEVGDTVTQRSPGRWRSQSHDDFAADPTGTDYRLDTEGSWRRIDPGHEHEPVTLRGRLVGGCVETMCAVAGGPFGDIESFRRNHAPDGIVHLLDIAEWNSYDVCRALHGMRLKGWFDGSRGILVSRTKAPAAQGFSQHDAVVDALGMLGVPIIADVECGHLAPYLALLNGAETTVTHSADEHSVVQTLT